LLKKVYQCARITIRQNKEEHGGQDVFHYHMHIFPRYKKDHFNKTSRSFLQPQYRNKYTKLLLTYLQNDQIFFDNG